MTARKINTIVPPMIWITLALVGVLPFAGAPWFVWGSLLFLILTAFARINFRYWNHYYRDEFSNSKNYIIEF